MSSRYAKDGYIGEGQFARVYKARDIETDSLVAIKKIKLGTRHEARDGVNRTALREVKLLQELRHENIIALLDVYGHRSSVSLVFEFMETDLEVIIRDNNIVLTPAHIKSYILMTLKGLEYLHLNWILHRDLKPNNLLLNSNNILKIADFGLARSFGSPTRIYTHQVVTRWYRAPELLFGARMYGTGVDIWAVGCILAELFLRAPFLPGESDLEQLEKIMSVLGTPNDTNWPGVKHLPDYVAFRMSQNGIPLREIFTAISEDAIDLLTSMLMLYPLNRCDCTKALKMPYFINKPYPTPPESLPLPKEVKDEIDKRSTASKRPHPDPVGPLAKRLNFA